jgi:hypothetical protein
MRPEPATPIHIPDEPYTSGLKRLIQETNSFLNAFTSLL